MFDPNFPGYAPVCIQLRLLGTDSKPAYPILPQD